MGYTHGKNWTETEIIDRIKEVVNMLELNRFPSNKEINNYYHNTSLTNKISKTGGFYYWANKLGLEIKESESKLGKRFELECLHYLQKMQYFVEKMPTKHPYDLLVNKNIKVDVKVSYLYKNKGNSPFYTFNLEKNCPTCDIYVCYCLNKEKSVEKVYVIPSCFLVGKTQLSVGVENSIYDEFIDKWSYFDKYNLFYKDLKTNTNIIIKRM